jgi:hypothetical protein
MSIVFNWRVSSGKAFPSANNFLVHFVWRLRELLPQPVSDRYMYIRLMSISLDLSFWILGLFESTRYQHPSG